MINLKRFSISLLLASLIFGCSSYTAAAPETSIDVSIEFEANYGKECDFISISAPANVKGYEEFTNYKNKISLKSKEDLIFSAYLKTIYDSSKKRNKSGACISNIEKLRFSLSFIYTDRDESVLCPLVFSIKNIPIDRKLKTAVISASSQSFNLVEQPDTENCAGKNTGKDRH